MSELHGHPDTAPPEPVDVSEKVDRMFRAAIVIGVAHVALSSVIIYSLASAVSDAHENLASPQPALAHPAQGAAKACAPVPEEDKEASKQIFATAPLYAEQPGSDLTRQDMLDEYNDKIISYIAGKNGLTSVSVRPFLKNFAPIIDIARDFDAANTYASQYGVQISPVEKPLDAGRYHGKTLGITTLTPGPTDDAELFPLKVRLTLQGIMEQLHEYPVEFVKEIGLKKIKIGSSNGAAGLAQARNSTIFIAAGNAGALNHEMFHLTDDLECEGHGGDDPGYEALNPHGFSYDEAQNNVTSPSLEQVQKDNTPKLEKHAFTFSEWGKTSVSEDKADEGARLIGSRVDQILTSKAKIVRQKLFYLAGRLLKLEKGRQYLQFFAGLSANRSE